MARFEDCIGYVLQNEGGFVNDPKDPGGATNYGITQKTYDSFFGKNKDSSSVEYCTLDRAKTIYKELYWDKLGLDSCPNIGVATAFLDLSVNRGVGIAEQYRDTIYNSAPQLTPDEVIKRLHRREIDAYHQIVARNPELNKFLKGWLNRADRLLTLLVAHVW